MKYIKPLSISLHLQHTKDSAIIFVFYNKWANFTEGQEEILKYFCWSTSSGKRD